MLCRSEHGDDDGRSLADVMRAWRVAHPRATFAEIEVEATCQVAALRTALIVAALDVEPLTTPVCDSCGRAIVPTPARLSPTTRNA